MSVFSSESLSSAFPEKLDDDRLDFLLQDFFAGRSDRKIIRITDEVDLVPPGAYRGLNPLFQPVERQVGQQG